MNNKAAPKKFTTPRGSARWPRLMAPDTKFEENGVYSCDVVVPKKEAQAFQESVKEFWREVLGEPPKNIKKLFKPETDEDDEPTGNVIIKCNVKNILPKKGKNAGKLWDRKPVVFDAARKPIPSDVVVGGGSTVRCCLEASYYNYPSIGEGVKFDLLSVQVIDLVTSGYVESGADADDFDDEDGYINDSPSGSDFDDEDGADDDSDF